MGIKSLIEKTASKYGFSGSCEYSNLNRGFLFKSNDGTLSVTNCNNDVDARLSMPVDDFTLELYSGYVNFNEVTLNKAISDVLAQKKVMSRCVMAFVDDGWNMVKSVSKYGNDVIIVSKNRNKLSVFTNGSDVILDGKRGKRTAVNMLHAYGVLHSTKQVPRCDGVYSAIV